MIEGDVGAKVGLIAYGVDPLGDRRGPRPAPRAGDRDRVLPRPRPAGLRRGRRTSSTRHERVYVIEQNRDGQVASLLRATLSGSLADRLRSVPHYNGTPIAAEQHRPAHPRLGEDRPPGPAGPPATSSSTTPTSRTPPSRPPSEDRELPPARTPLRICSEIIISEGATGPSSCRPSYRISAER